MRFLKSVLIALFAFILFFPHSALAQDFRDAYNVKYFVQQSGPIIDTLVDFTISITNLRSDLFVKKFSLTFPKTFSISGLKAVDDNGTISQSVRGDSQTSRIELEFNNPKTGKGTENTFHLTFKQNNLFKVNGNVWEVILPTIEGKREGDYQVEIHLPNSDKKISIAKPRPTRIENNVIYWKNPVARTIYAIFGDEQRYAMKLTYNLENPKFYKVYTDVAFPPDMLHQKIYVSSIQPFPSTVYTDEDGNYYGRYYLNPREKKTIVFNGFAGVSVKPRDDVREENRVLIALQEKYLLNQSQYWTISEKDLQKYIQLKTPFDIYSYITNTFHYDYQRISKNVNRLGATVALAHPNQAVCVEFSDSFITLARENGIFSREIEGYGFSEDAQLRPLSLIADVLHSWPEFYDKQTEMWQSVDPTWQNTSGIDYFSSFDLNHIAFAIHGKRSDYPFPAGMYKLEDTRDVSIAAVSQTPPETVDFKIKTAEIPKIIDDNRTYSGKVTIQNLGNAFEYNVPIEFRSTTVSVKPKQTTILSIAPLEEKTIEFIIQAPQTNRQSPAEIEIVVQGKTVFQQMVKIIPYYYSLAAKLSIILLSFCAIMIIIIWSKNRRKARYEEN